VIAILAGVAEELDRQSCCDAWPCCDGASLPSLWLHPFCHPAPAALPHTCLMHIRAALVKQHRSRMSFREIQACPFHTHAKARARTCAHAHVHTRAHTHLHTFTRSHVQSHAHTHAHSAGGIGIAAALSLFEELPPSPLLPVLLVWTARHPAELLLLAPLVIAAARDKGVALTAHLHYTGGHGSVCTRGRAGQLGSAWWCLALRACCGSARCVGQDEA
jgi:hypothetical protein